MKNSVSYEEYFESELKPADLMTEYINLSKDDIQTFFLSGNELKDCACPGCGSMEMGDSFRRLGLTYIECLNCCTLWVCSRPDDAAIRRYYKESAARKFFLDKISQRTRSKRLEKIIKPRMEWIIDSTLEYLPEASHLVDVNTCQFNTINELAGMDHFTTKVVIDPFLPLNEISRGNITILDTTLPETDLTAIVDVITLFEVVDRTSNVDVLFKKIRQLLKKNGLCFLTCILSSGFDFQVLWDKADNIIPPDRLNLFSVEGLNTLFDRHGFECLEFSTPGIFDVEITDKLVKKSPDIELPRFFKYMFEHRSRETCKNFQKFLQANLLSSYGRILLQKI